MTSVTDEYNYVVCVATHAKTHTYAVLAADTGRVIDSAMFPTSPTGISRALAWMRRRAECRMLIAIEGAGSYGAVIARIFQDAGLSVCDARRPNGLRAPRLRPASSGSRPPRSDRIRVALRVLLMAREALDGRRSGPQRARRADAQRPTQIGCPQASRRRADS